jgi:hypothetical protein
LWSPCARPLYSLTTILPVLQEQANKDHRILVELERAQPQHGQAAARTELTQAEALKKSLQNTNDCMMHVAAKLDSLNSAIERMKGDYLARRRQVLL